MWWPCLLFVICIFTDNPIIVPHLLTLFHGCLSFVICIFTANPIIVPHVLTLFHGCLLFVICIFTGNPIIVPHVLTLFHGCLLFVICIFTGNSIVVPQLLTPIHGCLLMQTSGPIRFLSANTQAWSSDSLSGRTSYRNISWSLEATRFVFRLFQSLWNLTSTSAIALPRCRSTLRAIWYIKHPISRLRDFMGSCGN